MGRDSGYIAIECGIAGGAEAVMIPENLTPVSEIVAILQKVLLRQSLLPLLWSQKVMKKEMHK